MLLCLRGFHPGDFRNIYAHTQRAQPPGGILKLQLRRLKVAYRGPRSVRDVLKEDVRLIHRQGFLVILRKVRRRHRIKDVEIRETHDLLRRCFVRILGKRLVAGKIYSGLRVLGKAHRGHVGEKGRYRSHQVREFGGRLDFLRETPFFLFHAFPLVGNVGDEDIEDPAVSLGFGEVAVIVHPANFAVLADDTVFQIVHVAPADLLFKRTGNGVIIIGMYDPPEGIACQTPEVLQILTAENLKHRMVGVYQLLRLFRFIDEKASRHVPPDLLDHVHRVLVPFEILSKHSTAPFVFTLCSVSSS